jgi:alanyl-tRNA synthetase
VVAQGRGMTVDEKGFKARMKEQKERAEFSGSGEAAVEAVFHKISDRVGATKFLGYEATAATSEIIALVAGGEEVTSVKAPVAGTVAVITRETPFYGEQGGQMGDTGTLRGPRASFKVTDARRPVSTLYVHLGELTEGELKVGDAVDLSVDVERRNAIRRNHSATHLLHWALRTTLGEHVAQKGSLVAPDRLRFDFSHFQPLTVEEKQKIEDLANARVLKNLPAQTEVLPIADAKKAGAVAFFGEKYGDTVRVLTMGESKEFCGGTHVSRTGDIGLVKITEESGVAQGVRRMEAVTGEGAIAYVRRLEQELGQAASQLRAAPLEVAGRIEKQQAELRERDKEIAKLKAQIASGGGGGSGAETEQVGKYRVLVRDVGVGDPKVLRETADKLKSKVNPGILVLVGLEGEKVALVCAVTPDAQDKFDAGQIVKTLGQSLGWKGGGRKDLAQGGGPLPAGTALASILESWRKQVHDQVAGIG